ASQPDPKATTAHETAVRIQSPIGVRSCVNRCGVATTDPGPRAILEDTFDDVVLQIVTITSTVTR
ncbi:MAG: hypothetical protein RIF41_08505, partial [Polyangiaceae bacterium]